MTAVLENGTSSREFKKKKELTGFRERLLSDSIHAQLVWRCGLNGACLGLRPGWMEACDRRHARAGNHYEQTHA